METSAKCGFGVESAFERLAEIIIANRELKQDNSPKIIQSPKTPVKKFKSNTKELNSRISNQSYLHQEYDFNKK